MYDYQGMVILTANQVWWTWEVEDVFRKVKRGDKLALKNYSKKLHQQIDDLVVQVSSPEPVVQLVTKARPTLTLVVYARIVIRVVVKFNDS